MSRKGSGNSTGGGSRKGSGALVSDDEDTWSDSSAGSRSVRSLDSYKEEISTRKGWLKKKSTWTNWKDVFVVVQGGIFLEFKKEDSSKPTKALPLMDCTVQPAFGLTGVKNTFGVFKKGKGNAPMFFKAETEGGLIQWVTAIKYHCADSEIEWKNDEMLEALGDAAIVAGPTGTILDLNAAAAKLFGYTRSQLIGQNVTIFMPESTARAHAGYLQRYIDTGEKRLIGKPRKFTVYRANGSELSVQLCLGELPNPATGEIRFLARFRTDFDEFTSQTVMGNVDAAIEAALLSAKEEISKQVAQNVQAMTAVLEKYKRSLGTVPAGIGMGDPDEESAEVSRAPIDDDVVQVSFAHVEVHDRISEGGGSGAIIYNCSVDGWACVMKEVNLANLKGEKAMSIVNEIAVLEKLPAHKNLVRYLFHRRTAQSVQIFMRLYHGTLHQEIARRQMQEKPFTANEVTRLAADIVTGLTVLHSRKLLHRDLKSDNIFITFDNNKNIGYLTLGDFDSAKQISSDNAVAHTVIGTPGYMAPEILLNQKYGFSADIFAFGMVLYELLTLQRPYFEERNAFKISQMIIEGKRPTTPELGPEWVSLIKLHRKCVHPKPERRPSLASCKSVLVKNILSEPSFSSS